MKNLERADAKNLLFSSPATSPLRLDARPFRSCAPSPHQPLLAVVRLQSPSVPPLGRKAKVSPSYYSFSISPARPSPSQLSVLTTSPPRDAVPQSTLLASIRLYRSYSPLKTLPDSNLPFCSPPHLTLNSSLPHPRPVIATSRNADLHQPYHSDRITRVSPSIAPLFVNRWRPQRFHIKLDKGQCPRQATRRRQRWRQWRPSPPVFETDGPKSNANVQRASTMSATRTDQEAGRSSGGKPYFLKKSFITSDATPLSGVMRNST